MDISAEDEDRSTPALAWSVDKACKMIGVSRAKLYRLLKAGDIKAKKSGSTTLFPVDNCRSYIDSLPDWTPANII